jgi:hypothetical protein
MGEGSKDASTNEGSGIFFATGLDSMSVDLPVGRKLGVAPTFFAAAQHPQFVIPGRIEDANSDVPIANRRIHNHGKEYGFRIAAATSGMTSLVTC